MSTGTPGTDRPVRVLWLIKGLGPGGAEQLLVSAARVSDRERFALHVAYVLPWKDALVPRLEELGVATTCLGSGKRPVVSWLPALRRHLAERRYDVVHVHSPFVAGLARAVIRTLPRSRRPAVVSTEHNEWGSYGWPTRLANAALYGGDAVRFAVSERVRRTIWRPFREDVRTLVHGIVPADADVPPGTRERIRAELGIGLDEFVVCTVANFRAAKGYPDLLAAAATVARARADVRFLAVGQGPLAEEITRQRDEMGLTDRVVMTGFRPDAIAIVAAADVFVLASHVEGYPIAVMEALATGVPVVATAVGGVADAVRDGVEGFLVPARDPQALADRVLALAEDPELRRRLSAAARARGAEFDISNAVREIEAAYLDAAVNGRARRSRPPARATESRD